jgi:predicted phage terminase large subunit-like protein
MQVNVNTQEELLVKEGWRLSLSKYAEVCSRGRSNWIPYRWVDYLADQVERVAKTPNGRLIVNAPPRMGKSFLMSQWLPIWYLDWFPSNRVILCSHGGDFAATWGKKVRDEFSVNPKVWTKLMDDSKARNSWNTKEGGGMHTAGVGGSIIGLGGDLILIDDVHKDFSEAMSPLMQSRVIDWFNGTLYHRLEPGGAIIIIMTRWNQGDLTGYLLEEHEDDWEHICFPALAEGDDDVLGRVEGEALCPERYTTERLNQIQKNIGSYNFAGLYQQRPAPLAGGMIKKDWYRYYDTLPEDIEEYIQTWDLTFKATGTSYVVGQVWARKGANVYAVDCIREKLGFQDQVKAILKLSSRYPEARTKIIEDAADAQAVKATLQDLISGVVLSPAKGSKEARLAACLGSIESGNVYLPRQAEWLDSFIAETTTFPNAVNDDQVDAMTLALNRFHKHSMDFSWSLPTSGKQSNPWKVI